MSERTPIRQCVIFGASGDLAARYLIPAFFELWIRGRLPPDLRILGVARENWDDATFRRHAAERTAVPHDGGEALPAEFLSMLRYDNVLELGLRPDRVGLQVNVNGVGDRLVLETIVLDRTLADQELSAYARLMLDVLNGDPSLSIRDDEVEESWRIMTPILRAWTDGLVPLVEYPAGSAGPSLTDAE